MKFLKSDSKLFLSSLVAAAAMSATSAFAVDPTLADMTSVVSFADIKTAIIAIGISSVSLVLIWKGVHMVIRAVRTA